MNSQSNNSMKANLQVIPSKEPAIAVNESTTRSATNGSAVPKTTTPLSVITFLISTLLLFGAIFAFGIVPRMDREKQEKAALSAPPVVPSFAVTTVQPGAPQIDISLPANIQAIQEFSIYARCDGYLKKRWVDIGDRVKTGQLLMEIDAPELGKQLMRAIADYRQTEAQVKSAQADLAQSISVVQNAKAAVKRQEAEIKFSHMESSRYQSLAADGAVSAEQRDEKFRDLNTDKAELEAGKAAVEAAQAQVNANREKIAAAKAAVDSALADKEEVQTMISFQRVVAPCDGVITARNVDAGALVSKGSGTSNLELLKMARTDTLRVFVYIPQSDLEGVYAGMPAKITVAELPNKSFDGKVAHISGGLDPTSRTLQAEVHIPNTTGKLLPGMFARVSLTAKRSAPAVLVPDSAVVVKPEGRFVVQVTPEGTAHYQPVKLGRDFGHDSEVLSGLNGFDKVLTNPVSDVCEGQTIKELPPEPKKVD